MKHYLRFMITLILATVWSLGGYAQTTVTFDATKDKSATETLTKEGVSIILEKGSNNSFGKLNNGTDYRAYSGNNLIVKSSVGNITQIVFTCTAQNSSKGGPGCLNTPSSGDYTYSSQTGTWKGSANSVSFKTSNQVKASKIVVTIAASKKLNSLSISGEPTKKTYNVGDTFAPAGLVVTGTYDDNSTATITDGITWATTPETLSAGTTSCSVTATVGDITSAQYSVTGLTVVAPTKLTFPQSSISYATTDDLTSFTGQTPTLTAGDETLTGKSFTYSKTGDDIFSSFNEETGVLALNGNAGTATVTAKFAGDDTYASTTGSYTVSVKSVVKDIATLKPQITSTSSSSTQSFSLKLTDAIVTYKNGNNAYVQDKTGGLFTTGGSSLNVGDKINGIVDVKAYIRSGQRTVTSWILSSDATIEKNVEFTPEVVTVAQLNENIDKYENMQVKVVGATVNAAMSNNQTTVSQDGEKIILFSKTSSITWELKADDYVDIVGFPCKYNKTNEICVWRKGDVTINESVIATTLSIDPATTEYTVEKGKESAFTAPTVTVTDANNEVVADAKITYKSSNTDVATVAEDGTVTFVGFGTTTITASYAGDATHKAAADISYTIIYGKVKTTMAWSETEAKANIGEENFTAPTLSLTADGKSILEGKTITYESTDENVAMVDEDGNVVLMDKEGTTKITAKFAGDDTYAESTASYTLTVVDPNKMEVTFDFTNPYKYGYGTTSGSTAFGEGAGDIQEGKSISEGLVTLTNTTVKNMGTRFYNDGLRMYDGNVHTLSVPAGYRITSVAFVGADAYKIEDAAANTSWTGSKRNVVIKYTGNNKKVTALTVGYKKVELSSITLNEEDNDIVVLENEKKNVNVTLDRTMEADGGWYTFCVPFDIDDISTTPLKDAEIRKYQSMTGSVMNFEATTSLKAAHAYLVKPTTDIANPVFNDVMVSLGDDGVDGAGGYKFVGILSTTDLATDGTNLFLGAGNKFYIPTPDKCTLKALRGYFVAPSRESGALMSIRIDDTTTSIAALNGNATTTNGKVYNLSGQYVGNDVKALPKGVYIVNGKKYIVK